MTKFLRLGPAGSEIPAMETADGVVHDLRPLTADIDGSFLESDGLRRARDLAAELPVLEGARELRVGPPIAHPGPRSRQNRGRSGHFRFKENGWQRSCFSRSTGAATCRPHS